MYFDDLMVVCHEKYWKVALLIHVGILQHLILTAIFLEETVRIVKELGWTFGNRCSHSVMWSCGHKLGGFSIIKSSVKWKI